MERKRYASLARDVRSIGITAVRFTPRGSRPDDMGSRYTQTRYIEDVQTILDVHGRNYDHIFTIGFCYGALTGFLHATRDSRVNGVAAIMPLPSFTEKTCGSIEEYMQWQSSGERVMRIS